MTAPDASAAARSPGLLRMAAPLVVSFWMRAAFTLVDTIYAATIGDEAVAAIGLTAPFEFLMIALWVGLSTGLTSVLSRAMGERAGRRIEQYMAACWRLVWVAVPTFIGLGAFIWFWAPHMGLAEETSRAFAIYGTVLVAGSGVSAFWSVLPDSMIKAHQDTRTTMWAGIASNVINVVLNTIFLFVFGWGVFGIALSTVLGRFGGLAYALWKADEHERARRAAWSETSEPLDPAPYRAILSLAIPSALTFGLMSLETAAVNFLLARLPDPTAAIAGYSIYYRVMMFMLNPVIAISVAMLPFAAMRFGARDIRGVRRGLRQALTASAAYCLFVAGPVMLLFGDEIAAWLAESPRTAAFATFGLWLVPLACLASTPFMLCRPVFEGMQRGRPGLVMAVFRSVLLTLPLAVAGMIAAPSFGRPGYDGLLVGLLVASTISSAVFLAWLLRALDAYELAHGPGSRAAVPAADPGGA